jgi:hypothetical protein
MKKFALLGLSCALALICTIQPSEAKKPTNKMSQNLSVSEASKSTQIKAASQSAPQPVTEAKPIMEAPATAVETEMKVQSETNSSASENSAVK